MMKIFFLSLTISFSLGAFAQAIIPEFINDELETYIEKGMEDWQVPAVAVGIIRNGEVIMAKGFGSTSAASPDPVDAETLFMIGSNTKLFTATALAHLSGGEQFDLSSPINTYMPSFSLNDPLASAQVNTLDLLSHRLGFETFQGDFTYWTSKLSRADIIQRMARLEAPHGFRTSWGYCNAAFVTAGELIPAITDDSWSAYVQKNILNPLEMTRTQMLSSTLPDQKNVAKPHSIINGDLVETAHVNIDNLAPAGSMSSSVNDMLKWLDAQTRIRRVYETNPGLAVAMMTTREPQSILGVNPTNGVNTHFHLYGLGLMINDLQGKMVYSHTGGINGYLSSVVMVPELDLGIVVLTNTDHNNFFQTLSNQIRDAFFDLPFENYSDQSLGAFHENDDAIQTRIDSWYQKADLKPATSLPLNDFAGDYHHDFYGEIKIEAQEESLLIRFEQHPHLTAELRHIGDDTFVCTYSDHLMGVVPVPFTITDGRVHGLKLSVNDFVERTIYEFVKN